MNTAPPTRRLVETSVGIREVARELARVSFTWDMPQHILVVTKPDEFLIPKALEITEYLLRQSCTKCYSLEENAPCDQLQMITLYVEDKILGHKKFKDIGFLTHGHIRSWNAESLRHSQMLSRVYDDGLKSCDGEQNNVRFPSLQHLNQRELDQTSSAEEQLQGGINYISPEDIDFVITLGGDGTVLYTSWLFQRYVPPILPFHLGSLGFLTVFDFTRHREALYRILRSKKSRKPERFSENILDLKDDRGMQMNLRARLTCSFYRYETIMSCNKSTGECVMEVPETTKIELNQTSANYTQRLHRLASSSVISNITTSSSAPEPDAVFQILNDLVVDRGPSAYMSQLEVFGDGRHLTTVQADGLIISTPTGSTAYALSAGGPLVHPDVPAMLLTPICPHTLSFRPMLLPLTMDIKVVVPIDSRNGAWASFDGRYRMELRRGDAIGIRVSNDSVPTICKDNQTIDWFESLKRCLRWNDRAVENQKSFVWGHGVVSEP